MAEDAARASSGRQRAGVSARSGTTCSSASSASSSTTVDLSEPLASLAAPSSSVRLHEHAGVPRSQLLSRSGHQRLSRSPLPVPLQVTARAAAAALELPAPMLQPGAVFVRVGGCKTYIRLPLTDPTLLSP